MTRLLEQAALLCTAAGLIAGALVVGSTRDPRLGLRVALEFFMAAGLLRLAGPLSAMTLATSCRHPRRTPTGESRPAAVVARWASAAGHRPRQVSNPDTRRTAEHLAKPRARTAPVRRGRRAWRLHV
ncbi:MAG: hypothetical protein WKF73_08485 [Nocardioidaceae bacterium]